MEKYNEGFMEEIQRGSSHEHEPVKLPENEPATGNHTPTSKQNELGKLIQTSLLRPEISSEALKQKISTNDLGRSSSTKQVAEAVFQFNPGGTEEEAVEEPVFLSSDEEPVSPSLSPSSSEGVQEQPISPDSPSTEEVVPTDEFNIQECINELDDLLLEFKQPLSKKEFNENMHYYEILLNELYTQIDQLSELDPTESFEISESIYNQHLESYNKIGKYEDYKKTYDKEKNKIDFFKVQDKRSVASLIDNAENAMNRIEKKTSFNPADKVEVFSYVKDIEVARNKLKYLKDNKEIENYEKKLSDVEDKIKKMPGFENYFNRRNIP